MSDFINTMGRMFDGFSAGSPLGKLLIGAGSLLTAFYSPIIALLVACFAFTVTDMIYGIKVALKNK